MEFVWTPDQREFRAGVRRQLATRAPVSRARALLGQPHDADLWRELAQQSGLQGIAVPEEHGGSGGTRVELAIVAEELGRVLYGGPFLSTSVLATEALLAAGDGELLPALVEGERTAALAVVEDPGRWSTDDVRTRADDRGRLTGRKTAVLDGAGADLLLVVAQGPAGPSLYAVDAGAPGLTRTPREVLDLTRPVADVELRDTPGRLIGTGAAAVVERVVEAASIFLAAEQVGGQDACVAMTADYARTRRQFGRTIGSFQGVKHRLADMAVRLEQARSAAYWAAWQDPGSYEARLGASVARAYCSDAFVQTAKDTIQLHGGIGFTWEHDAHLYLRRARADASLVGDAAEHRRGLLPLLDRPLAQEVSA